MSVSQFQCVISNSFLTLLLSIVRLAVISCELKFLPFTDRPGNARVTMKKAAASQI